ERRGRGSGRADGQESLDRVLPGSPPPGTGRGKGAQACVVPGSCPKGKRDAEAIARMAVVSSRARDQLLREPYRTPHGHGRTGVLPPEKKTQKNLSETPCRHAGTSRRASGAAASSFKEVGQRSRRELVHQARPSAPCPPETPSSGPRC